MGFYWKVFINKTNPLSCGKVIEKQKKGQCNEEY